MPPSMPVALSNWVGLMSTPNWQIKEIDIVGEPIHFQTSIDNGMQDIWRKISSVVYISICQWLVSCYLSLGLAEKAQKKIFLFFFEE